MARRIVIFTGAGMSAESGIPTFRDRGTGLWADIDPMDVATPLAFRDDPQRVWDWHVHLAEAVRVAEPNAGHLAVADLEAKGAAVTVITQNIDNLHQLAGSNRVIELHGNLLRLKPFVDEWIEADPQTLVSCPMCGGRALPEALDPFASPESLSGIELRAGPVPRCPCCGSYFRPDVVWFWERLSDTAVEDAQEAADFCDVLIAVGASLAVEPAASLPWRALNRGARVIEVNPHPTHLAAACQESYAGSAVEVLPELLARLLAED